MGKDKIDDELAETVRRIQIETTHLADGLFAGAYRSAFKGRGIEFEDVREFQPGDEVRSIDWNVTAKMARPYIKNFREERELTVMLIVDASSSTRFGSKNVTKNKLIAQIGALIAFSAIKSNDRVGLIIFADEVEIFLSPKKGVRHVLRLIRELLMSPKSNKKTNLKEALSYFGEVQTNASICFVISDFMCQDFSHEFSLLSKKHDMILVSVLDPMEISLPNVNLAELMDLETGKHTMVDTGDSTRRRIFEQAAEKKLSELKKLAVKEGSGFIDIRTDGSYVKDIEKFFKTRSHPLK